MPTPLQHRSFQEASPPPEQHWKGSVFTALPIFLLLYLLSIGPAFWIYNNTDHPLIEHGLPMFFVPIEVLAEKNEMVYDLVEAYVELWE